MKTKDIIILLNNKPTQSASHLRDRSLVLTCCVTNNKTFVPIVPIKPNINRADLHSFRNRVSGSGSVSEVPLCPLF